VYNLLIDDLTSKIELVKSKENLRRILGDICLLSSNERSNKEIILLLDKAIEKSELLNDELSLANLIGFKIPMLYNKQKNIPKVRKLISRMQSISEENNYSEILSWTYSYRWYIEKFTGNKKKAKEYINYSMAILEKSTQSDKYINYFVKYSYAFEQWIEENNANSALIFEECVDFFHKEGFYRSLVQALAVLFVIYQETQNKEGALKATQKLLSNKIPFDNLPRDIQAISYYFVGLSHKLQLNLSLAERYLEKVRKILKETFEKSTYSFYYIPVLTHLSTVLALQGKIEQALELIKTAETLLQGKIFANYSDPISSRQLKHSFNLINFYIKSRIYDSTSDEITNLIDNIHTDCKINYSNAIMLTEFLLNANLNHEQLKELRNTNNASLERVKHIINFLMIKVNPNSMAVEEQNYLDSIKVLQERFKINKMTFIEKAYSDLLIAQQLFSLKQFAEIYVILKKYENQVNKIEVLELRIFMEGFIQVGAYKCGDPLGPALQYMAIKKCRMHGFSRLENTLLNYLDMQRMDVLQSK
jgi:tetratricopeptide (TPR) repeat protein